MAERERKKMSNGPRFVYVSTKEEEDAWRAKGYAEAGPSALAAAEVPAEEAEAADAEKAAERVKAEEAAAKDARAAEKEEAAARAAAEPEPLKKADKPAAKAPAKRRGRGK